MITRFITDVTTRFNPFTARSKSARLFLSFLPPTARSSGMNITAQMLPRASTEPSTLLVKFSTSHAYRVVHPMKEGDSIERDRQSKEWLELLHANPDAIQTEDGKELNIDCEAMGIKSIIEEVDRHSRALQKAADLADG